VTASSEAGGEAFAVVVVDGWGVGFFCCAVAGCLCRTEELFFGFDAAGFSGAVVVVGCGFVASVDG